MRPYLSGDRSVIHKGAACVKPWFRVGGVLGFASLTAFGLGIASVIHPVALDGPESLSVPNSRERIGSTFWNRFLQRQRAALHQCGWLEHEPYVLASEA